MPVRFLSKEKVTLIKDTIKLARERRIACERHTMSTPADFIERSRSNALEQEVALYFHLLNLDYEDVKFLQTVMYVGRDEEVGDSELAPEKLYREVRNILTWTNKAVEIKQMFEKQPLDEYLGRGLELLNR